MRPIASLALVGLVLTASLSAQETFGPPAPGAVPMLRVEPMTVDLGECYFGESVEGSVELHNDGTADLVIHDVKTTCGCTVAPLAPGDKVVPPGESVTVPITMTPKGTASPLTKYLQIQTNAPQASNLSIAVQCRVKVGAVADPRYVLFRDAKIGESPSQTVQIISENGEPFTITGVDVSTDAYIASWDEEAEPALEQQLTITAAPISQRNVPASQVTVKLDHPRTKQIMVSANTMVAPLVAKSSNRLMYTPIAPGESGTTTIDLWRTEDGEPLESLSVKMPQSPHITFDVERDAENPRTWHITAHVPPDETRPVIGAAVWLETDVVDEGPIAMMCVLRIAQEGASGAR